MANPEFEQAQLSEQNGDHRVESRPEDLAIPEHIEQGTGVTSVPSQATSLTDDQGQMVAQSQPEPPNISAIQIPADPQTAQSWSQGSSDDSSTWLGVFVIRKVKQAIALGRKIIIGK
jgi:hypothetical protein